MQVMTKNTNENSRKSTEAGIGVIDSHIIPGKRTTVVTTVIIIVYLLIKLNNVKKLCLKALLE